MINKILGVLVVLTFFGVPALAYTQTNLVSDVPNLAKFTDPNLVNSWGIIHSSASPWWVADNGMGVSTTYNGDGVIQPLVVTIPGVSGTSSPTGIISNEGTDFEITHGSPAKFIFVTEDGTIAAWNPSLGTTAVIKVNNFPDAVYKGAAIAFCSHCGNDMLYVANFREGKVDVFDTNFNKVNMDGFVDNNIPAGFAPFNVINIEGNLVVTYAKQNAEKHDDVAGPGNGFVDIFDPHGNLIRSLKHGFWLNSPWGVAKAPADFGRFGNLLLIGNFGSGNIAGFDDKGNFHGLLRTDKGKPITIDGLWGLGFGNDGKAGPSNTLFFAAGINHENDGLFGKITEEKNKNNKK